MILIAGAGISGLSLGFHLSRKQKDFIIVDPASEAGGKIRTVQRDGYQMDTGPNTLLADSQVMEFLAEAGLSDEWLLPAAISKKRFIFRNGRFHGLSAHPLSLACSPLISWQGKWRIWQERNLKSQSPPGESFAAFVNRRFGQEALQWIATPVQYGIHAADPEQLLTEDAFPKLLQLEKEYGSVIRGLQKTSSGSRAQTLGFRGGMQTLSRKLALPLANRIRLNTSLEKIEAVAGGWKCLLSGVGKPESVLAEEIILCMPAPQAAGLLHSSGMGEMASLLEQISYQSLAVAHMAFQQNNKKEFQGFGGLVPPAAGYRSAGAIWASSLFPGRAPAGMHLLAGFFGGALQPEAGALSEDQIRSLLQEENAALYGRKADAFPDITIWKEAIPSYNLQRKLAVEKLETIRPGNLHFLSNWKGGIGLADCIRNAAILAQKFLA